MLLIASTRSQPRIFQRNPAALLIDAQTLQGQPFVIALKPVVVLLEPAEVSLDDLLDLYLPEGSLIEPPLADLLPQGVVVLPLENEVEVLLVGTVASAV
jgi:hypothetical protein